MLVNRMREATAFRKPQVKVVGIALALILLTLFTFWGVWKNGFVAFDDSDYIYANRSVQQGLHWETICWAFNCGYAFNWHPLTWLSHALDCQLFGLNPGGHHVVNLLLHTANVLLLFLAVRLLTGAFWRSAMVAALFAIHPLHVESVVWAAERKDVLSGFFFMLTVIAYAKYAKAKSLQPSTARQPEIQALRSGVWYWLALGFFASGLMSKPMLVTVPFVLVLLDYWPLGRFGSRSINASLPRSSDGVERSLSSGRTQAPSEIHNSEFTHLLWEKAPFFLLALISCVLTLNAQSAAIVPTEVRPVLGRVGDALLAYVAYLQQTFWPTNLAVFYPKAALDLPLGPFGAALVLVSLTVTFALVSRKHPYAIMGWLLYLGMLVPVIGVVRVGAQAQADRYTYLPLIGIFTLVTWGLESITPKAPADRATVAGQEEQSTPSGYHPARLPAAFPMVVMSLAVAAVLCALSVAAHRQVSLWRNSKTLFTHAAKVTRNNYVALTSLANLDLEQGHLTLALTNAEHVLEFAPEWPMAQYVVGTALQRQGKSTEALPHLLAVGEEPSLVVPLNARLALCFLEEGRWTDADTAMSKLLAAAPHDPVTGVMEAALLKEEGRSKEALQLFQRVTAAVPTLEADNPILSYEIAELFELAGESSKAVPFYTQAIDAFPRFTNALNNLAWILSTDPDPHLRNGPRAVDLAEEACRLTNWKQAVLLGTLAAAYAEAGRFAEAVEMAERARDIARACALEALAKRNEELLELYRQHKPYRDSGS